MEIFEAVRNESRYFDESAIVGDWIALQLANRDPGRAFGRLHGLSRTDHGAFESMVHYSAGEYDEDQQCRQTTLHKLLFEFIRLETLEGHEREKWNKLASSGNKGLNFVTYSIR